jgi:uncharacterized OsmC-like protein
MTTTEQTLNGIDTGALRSTIQAVAENAAAGKARFHARTRWSGGTRSQTHVEKWALGGKQKLRNFTMSADEPVELLGTAEAPNPQEILMAGLNACMTVGYVAGCALKGITLDSLEIETEGELDLRGFLGIDAAIKPGYDELRYTVRIRGNGTKEQFNEIHRTVMATSPNFFNMANAICMKPTLVVE